MTWTQLAAIAVGGIVAALAGFHLGRVYQAAQTRKVIRALPILGNLHGYETRQR